MTMKYVLCLAVLVVSLRNIGAHISKEGLMTLTEYSKGPLDECAKELNLKLSDLQEKYKSLDDLNDIEKCLFACVLQKKGMLNQEGKVDVKKALEIALGLIKNSDDYRAIETIGKSCESVNEEKVSDGVKGCERTILLMTCVIQHKADISLDSQIALVKYSRGFLDECAQEINLNLDDIMEQLKSLLNIDDTVKCLFACALKKKGMLNDEGKVDVEKGLEILNGVVKNSDDYKVLESVGNSCASVNDEKVSDGVEGCERTFLLISCIMKHEELFE